MYGLLFEALLSLYEIRFLRLILRCKSNFFVFLVSSQSKISTDRNSLIALKLISSKLPIGVAIKYKHPFALWHCFRSSLLTFFNILP